MPARDKVEIPAVSKELKLLADFIFYVFVVWKNATETFFKCINFIQVEFRLADRINAFHDFDEPASRIRPFIPKEKCSLPFR